ncbi:DUF362 domain-containing protein [Tengunoibacter tsumagoiensis]|uniref:DUF362 domain-containing protein n=1 Tax=Tengunoibacter tsumagoiensis TaxID=2014871 RepID=A0A402A902_9CHLR|nr:DUF362 domain-containing protein [Tengunoibacter tsumagoiensis]GCE15623.1 hypothetical protein KTT_54820 [Tengunoibacter tsumagoiensis]
MNATVALLRAGRDLTQATDELLALLGSPLDALQAGMRVVIKPNMFQVKPGFQSHPELVCAVARLVAAKGAKVTVAERTRNIYTLLKDTDIHRYATVMSFDDCSLRVAAIEGATSLRVPVAFPEIILDCDYFIGIPQLRAHAGVLVTNAMKNLIGMFPGYTTRIVHTVGVEESIVDLNLLRHQDLVITDATTVIEGNYPINGVAREVGLLSASTSAVSIDAVMSTVAGYDPFEVEYLRIAHNRGLGTIDLNEITVVGLRPADVAFTLNHPPYTVQSPREGIHIYAQHACIQCQRYIAGSLLMLEPELQAYDGELTIISGPMETLPEVKGRVVLIGNCTYQHRDAGVYVEGCPPRAIQSAAFKYALGQEVTADQRTQFRTAEEHIRAQKSKLRD